MNRSSAPLSAPCPLPLARVAALLVLTTSLACGGAGDDDGSAGDAGADGGRDGFTLTDIDPFGESWVVEPSSIRFTDRGEGIEDVRGLRITNQSTARQELRDLRLVEADGQVRFPLATIVDLGRRFDWADTDGDGQDFESRELGIPVGPGEFIELSLEFRPDGRPSECLDPAPSACGFFTVSGPEVTVSIPLFVPR
jgi:hypothetical protein